MRTSSSLMNRQEKRWKSLILYQLFILIIRQLSTADVDTLFTIYSQYRGTSSDEQTLECIIKYLYKIPFEIITSEVDLYKALLSIHYKKNELPEVVIKYLLNRWRTLDLF